MSQGISASNGFKWTSDKLLPVLAIALSVLTIARNLDLSNILSFIVSVIGIAGGITYFLKRKLSLALIAIWIYAQIPAISQIQTLTYANGSQATVKQAYWDAGQTLTVHLGLTLGSWDLQVNVVPFGLLILFRLLQVSALVGGTVTIRTFKNSKTGEASHLTGTAMKRVTLGKEKHWLLVQLASEIIHSGRKYSHLLITSKDGEILKRGKQATVSYIVLVSDPAQVHDGVNKREDYEFLEWGYVSIT